MKASEQLSQLSSDCRTGLIPDRAEYDMPSPLCPNCGAIADDGYGLTGEYFESGYGPFPIYSCLACGAEIDWE